MNTATLKSNTAEQTGHKSEYGTNRDERGGNKLEQSSAKGERGSDQEERGSYKEGNVAKMIEQQAAKLPSDTFLWGALASIGASLAFRMVGRKDTSQFIGQWVPTLLIFGVYNKIVKEMGSSSKEERE